MSYYLKRSIFLFIVFGFYPALKAESINAERWAYDLVSQIEHPEKPFTQGLELHGDVLYESSGLYNQSYIYRKNLDDKKSFIKMSLPSNIFAEGITILNKKGYLLTWQNQQGYVFDPVSMNITTSFPYVGEGWGLTNDNEFLIMSNGSDKLVWLSPKDYSIVKELRVKKNGKPLSKLNELEWVDKKIYANIWLTNEIAVIDSNKGNVIATIDFSDIAKSEKIKNTHSDVLNGIAYDRKDDTFWITGKKWKSIYKVRLLKKEEAH